MWIKTKARKYINAETGMCFKVLLRAQFRTYDIVACPIFSDKMTAIAVFDNEVDAYDYLDKMMKIIGGRIFEVDTEDWNYTGHKKDRKETRRGGS